MPDPAVALSTLVGVLIGPVVAWRDTPVPAPERTTGFPVAVRRRFDAGIGVPLFGPVYWYGDAETWMFQPLHPLATTWYVRVPLTDESVSE